LLILYKMCFTHIYIYTSTHTHKHNSAESIHSSTFCTLFLPYAQSRRQHRKECITIPPSSSHLKNSRKACNRSVNRVPDSSSVTGTAHKDNSEFRPNKQLSIIGVSYCNSKALFYKDHYIGGNSLCQY